MVLQEGELVRKSLPAVGGYMTVLFSAVDCGNIARVDMNYRVCWHSIANVSCTSGTCSALLSVVADCSYNLAMSFTDFAQAFGVIT